MTARARAFAAVALAGAALLVGLALRARRVETGAPPDPAAAERAAALRERGDRLQAAGRPYRAVEYYLRAQREWPDDLETWRRLGAAALVAQQRANAQRAADRLLALDPGDAGALALRAAAEQLPTPASARSGRPRAVTRRRCAAAKRLVDRGRLDDAAIVLQAAAWLDERAVTPQRYLANIAHLQGRIDDAVAHQRAAVERAPANEMLRRNLARLEALRVTPPVGD